MINFYLSQFMLGRQFLWQTKSQAETEKRRDPWVLVPKSVHERIKQEILEAIRYCVAPLDLREASATSIDLENLVNNYEFQPYTWDRLCGLLDRLWDQIELGIQAECFFHYPREMARQRLCIDIEWKETIVAFPSSRPEIEAGIDCNALGDLSGAVFHMMRVAELGLRMIAKERGIRRVGRNKPLEWGMWREVFDGIEVQLKAIRNKPPGPRKDAALAFYDKAIADLRTMQGLYRDPTMHFRDKYNPGEAQSAIFRTKSLMQMLATKLTEQSPRKIRWGF